jgi:hypothetical protein
MEQDVEQAGAQPGTPADPGERTVGGSSVTDEAPVTGEQPAAAEPAVAVAGPAAAEPAATGDPHVDEALGKLSELAGTPVHEHPAIFEQVHAGLSQALGALDSDPAARTPGTSASSGTSVTRGTPAPRAATDR